APRRCTSAVRTTAACAATRPGSSWSTATSDPTSSASSPGSATTSSSRRSSPTRPRPRAPSAEQLRAGGLPLSAAASIVSARASPAMAAAEATALHDPTPDRGRFFRGPTPEGGESVAAEDFELKHYLDGETHPAAALEWAGETRAQLVDLKFCDLLGTW